MPYAFHQMAYPGISTPYAAVAVELLPSYSLPGSEYRP